MNRVFAKSVAALFCGAVLLASATAAHARKNDTGWYCVKMPTHGQTKWTKRDNNIQLRVIVRTHIAQPRAVDFKTWGKGRAGWGKMGFRDGFFDVAGNIIRADYHSSYGKQHFHHGGRTVCVPMHILQRRLNAAGIGIHEIRMEVKHGWLNGKCPTVKGFDVHRNHLFKISQRHGDLLHPFSCSELRPEIDSPWAGVKNRHEQQKAGRVKPQAWYLSQDRLPWDDILYKWIPGRPSALGTGKNERAGWDRDALAYEYFLHPWGGKRRW